LDVLDQIPSDRPAIIGPEGVSSFGALTAAAKELAPALRGRRLVLNTPDVSGAAVILAAADGRAEAIALMSSRHNTSMLAPLMALVDADAVISPNAESLLEAGLAAPVLANLNQAAELRGSRRRRAPSGEATRWIMTTSGTTSVPKLVQHSFSSLARTTRRDVDRGQGQIWGMVYDYTRFAGLQVMLQSLLSGACLAVPPGDAELDAQLGFLAEHGCTHLSATPTLWRKILMTPKANRLPLRQVTLGGEIADETVLASLANHYPQARISHIFASTEAGVGFSVSDKKAGFPAQYLVDPPLGIELKIEQGRLRVRNEGVGTEYLGGGGLLSDGGWVDTGDMVDVQGDRVYFKGRESGVINVGGNKVHPEEVERAILSHPHVAMARVYPRFNPITGALVAADVMATEDAPETLRTDLIRFLRGRLEKHAVPAVLRLTRDFVVNAAGKVERNA
jgi:acyl-coenzyme A synthetase/AMP-(fatty) acid ligase